MEGQGSDLVGIVPPDLTVGIEGTSAVEVEIVSGKEPERGAKTRESGLGENRSEVHTRSGTPYSRSWVTNRRYWGCIVLGTRCVSRVNGHCVDKLTETAELDVDVLETGDYEDGVDDIVLVENDGSSRSASVERVDDVWTVILATSDRGHGAGVAVDPDVGGGVRRRGDGDGDEREEGREAHGE